MEHSYYADLKVTWIKMIPIWLQKMMSHAQATSKIEFESLKDIQPQRTLLSYFLFPTVVQRTWKHDHKDLFIIGLLSMHHAGCHYEVSCRYTWTLSWNDYSLQLYKVNIFIKPFEVICAYDSQSAGAFLACSFPRLESDVSCACICWDCTSSCVYKWCHMHMHSH